MFGRKTRELQELLTQRNSENELMKKRIAELEEEVKRLKDQEDMVVRSITEANKTAARIEQEAGVKRDELVAEAEKQVQAAAARANDIVAMADEEAAATKKEADDYSENIRTDANIYVERTIVASQMEVVKRKEIMAQLNELLKQTTEHLNEQMESFSAMLRSVIDDNEAQTKELCADIEKCGCSCSECENPCMEEHEEGPCCEEAPVEAAPEAAPFEEPAAAPAEDMAKDLQQDEEEIDPSELPEEYKTPAELMHNIYYIQRRDIPTIAKATDFSDISPEGGITFADEMEKEAPGSDLPCDEKLEELVSEVVSAS